MKVSSIATSPASTSTPGSLRPARSAMHADLHGDERTKTGTPVVSRLHRVLSTGDFVFVVAAQRFTDAMHDRIRYLNEQSHPGKVTSWSSRPPRRREPQGLRRPSRREAVPQGQCGRHRRQGERERLPRRDSRCGVSGGHERTVLDRLGARPRPCRYSKGASIRLSRPTARSRSRSVGVPRRRAVVHGQARHLRRRSLDASRITPRSHPRSQRSAKASSRSTGASPRRDR